MKDNKKLLYSMVIVALILSVVGISIGFAAMSAQLTVNGTTTVTPATWKIKFQELAKVSGDDTLIVTAPQITSDTHIGNYALKLTKPGDKVVYKFQVANTGTLDAILTSYTFATPTITGTGATATDDAAIVSRNLIYTLTHNDATNSAIQVGETLNVNQSTEFLLTVEYDANADELPTDDVTISGMDITFTYGQN